MCTVKELKEYLSTLSEDMEVEVLEEYSSSYHTSTRWVPLVIEEYSDTCNVFNGVLYLGEN